MATTQKVAVPEERVILSDVSWETYESLLTDYADRRVPHFTYDRGVLEIVSPTFRHDRINRTLATVVDVVADELDIDILEAGSTTFRRQELQRGFEPDSSFYIQHAEAIGTKLTVDLDVDPPPDLVIEIDVSNPSLDKLPIYAAMGVPEIWRYVDATKRVIILRLNVDAYRESSDSGALPPMTSEALATMVNEGLTLRRAVWKRRIRAWIHDHS